MHDDQRAPQDRGGDALAEQQDGQAGGDERIQVDEGRGDGGANLLDADEPEEPAAGSADEASENE